MANYAILGTDGNSWLFSTTDHPEMVYIYNPETDNISTGTTLDDIIRNAGWEPNTNAPVEVTDELDAMFENEITKGDIAGHAFHGNQYTGGLGGGEHQDTERLLNEAIDRTIASLPTVKPKDNDWVVGQSSAPNSGHLKAYVAKNIAEKLGDKFDRGLGIRRMDEPIINIYGTPTKPMAQCFTRDDLWSVGNYNDINGEPQALWTYVGNATDPQIQEYLAGANNDYTDEHFTRGDTQGFAEARIGEKESNDQALRESKVSELVGQWAQTSNNNSYKSLAIQQVVGEVFGLKEAVDWKISPSTQEDINYYRENNDEFLKAFVQAQYDTTQQFLKDNNITSVQVYRGFSFLHESEQVTAYTRVKAPDWAKGVVGNPNAEGTSVTVPLRPISAFASNYAEAGNFAGNPGLIIQGTIPASQVFSLPTTGFGCLGEKEVVVLGNATDWKVAWASPPTKVVTKGDVAGHEFHGNQYTGGMGGANGKSRVESNAQTLVKSLSLQKRLKKDFNGTASQLKENICKDIAQRFGDKWDKQLGLTSPQWREEAVSQLIAQWAHTSNNADPMSLAIQEAAVKEFGITNAKNWEVNERTQAEVSDILGEKGEMLQAFLRAQYDATQEYFKGAGIKEVTLYRGFSDKANKLSNVEEGSSTEIPLRPLSSFTTSNEVATWFGTTIISGTVPVERLLSCYGTGFGCQNENELVVLGGEGQWQFNGQMDFHGADLSGADLNGTNLSDSDLSGANLTGANLDSANLFLANLSNANLTNAYMTGANLTYANLTNADLTGANLQGTKLMNTNLTGTNLTNADLSKVKLTSAIGSDTTALPEGSEWQVKDNKIVSKGVSKAGTTSFTKGDTNEVECDHG